MEWRRSDGGSRVLRVKRLREESWDWRMWPNQQSLVKKSFFGTDRPGYQFKKRVDTIEIEQVQVAEFNGIPNTQRIREYTHFKIFCTFFAKILLRALPYPLCPDHSGCNQIADGLEPGSNAFVLRCRGWLLFSKANSWLDNIKDYGWRLHMILLCCRRKLLLYLPDRLGLLDNFCVLVALTPGFQNFCVLMALNHGFHFHNGENGSNRPRTIKRWTMVSSPAIQIQVFPPCVNRLKA